MSKKLDVSKFIVLPSSIHEMIVIPDDGKCAIEELSKMVQEVNQTQIEPEERLTDQAYVIEVWKSGFYQRKRGIIYVWH